jgi:hypothetical protein
VLARRYIAALSTFNISSLQIKGPERVVSGLRMRLDYSRKQRSNGSTFLSAETSEKLL